MKKFGQFISRTHQEFTKVLVKGHLKALLVESLMKSPNSLLFGNALERFIGRRLLKISSEAKLLY